MGIQSLHQHIKSITEPVHLAEYNGCIAGIDAYGWLHRGAQACPMELCQGKPTDKFVTFCMSRVELLQKHGVKPLLVFDGAALCIKRGENAERRRQRDEALKKAVAAHAKGDLTTARAFFSRAVFVSHQMAHQLISALKQRGVPFLVAPYEADSQLAYLSRNGLVDLVITEDGDSLVLGCKRVLFKLDPDGNGVEVCLRNLGANTELSLVNWSPDMFLDMCLLAGCDYVPSVPGLGIKTAHRLVREHRNPKRLLEALRRSKKFRLPDGFEDAFWKARAAFRHMRVYDPRSRACVPLTPETDAVVSRFPGDGGLDFLGPVLPQNVAQLVAGGLVNPKTYQPWPVAATAARALAPPWEACLAPSVGGHGGDGREDGGGRVVWEVSTADHVAAALERAADEDDAAAAALASVRRRGRVDEGEGSARIAADDDTDDDNFDEEEEGEWGGEQSGGAGLGLRRGPWHVPFGGRQGLLRSGDFRSPAISDAVKIMHRGGGRQSKVAAAGAPHEAPPAVSPWGRPGSDDGDDDSGVFRTCRLSTGGSGHPGSDGGSAGRHAETVAGMHEETSGGLRKRPASGSWLRRIVDRDDRDEGYSAGGRGSDGGDDEGDCGDDDAAWVHGTSALSVPCSQGHSQASEGNTQGPWDGGSSRRRPLPIPEGLRRGPSVFHGCGSAAAARGGDISFAGPTSQVAPVGALWFQIPTDAPVGEGTHGRLFQFSALSRAVPIRNGDSLHKSIGTQPGPPFASLGGGVRPCWGALPSSHVLWPGAGGTPYDFGARFRRPGKSPRQEEPATHGPDFGRPFFALPKR